MKTLQFRITLLSDVILNQKSATEGSNSTLDFIPGNCFLGIAASHLYANVTPEEALDLFHTGKVRYGDAHPVAEGGKHRSLKVPSSFFYEKLHSVSEACYIYHKYNRAADEKKMQLKQCRHGFYAFESMSAQPVETSKTYVLKSAHDKVNRRSKDGALYGYESMGKGQEFLFSVECDDEKYADLIKKALTGIRRIGRSRNAQYGLGEIREDSFTESKSNVSPCSLTTVYADGRLIFFDEHGLPTFQPTAEQLGFNKEDTIRWDLSQIRTFQYSPWNGARQAYEADRCGIEKGSVFVVETKLPFSPALHFVGNCQYEGFGAVIYNPDFLESENGTNGLAKYSIRTVMHEPSLTPLKEMKATPLLLYLEHRAQQITEEEDVFNAVNEFVDRPETLKKFKAGDATFKSQWGNIRMIAMEKENPDDIISGVKDYISHGKASKAWSAYGRDKLLLDALREYEARGVDIRKLTINLASEMAKKL